MSSLTLEARPSAIGPADTNLQVNVVFLCVIEAVKFGGQVDSEILISAHMPGITHASAMGTMARPWYASIMNARELTSA
jgi:hypothetical protein